MPIEMLNLFGHVFYACLVFGMLLLAKKNKWGWLFRFIGELGWLWIGFELEMSSVWFWGIVFLFVEVYGFYSWTKKS